MNRRTAIVLVSNDLITDQRVHRTCLTLGHMGYQVTLVGRKLPSGLPLFPRTYRTARLKFLFRKGPAFYAEMNLRFLFYLLVHHASLFVSNDLDTLPGTWLAYRVKSHRVFKFLRNILPGHKTGELFHLHDCHEYFRGVPELVGRKKVTATWKWFEDSIFPRLELVTAVNESVAELYRKEYHVGITVLRNVPLRKKEFPGENLLISEKIAGRKVILYQGAVNVGRGLEEVVTAMKYLKTDALLIIAGTGDIFHTLENHIRTEGVQEKIILTGQIPFEQLHQYTALADLGLSIEKDLGINYHYCLPNKFLDYIQAGIPSLVSPFPEMRQIVEQYGIGDLLISHDPEILSRQLDNILNNKVKAEKYRKNLVAAAEELCWEKEEGKLVGLLKGRIIE